MRRWILASASPRRKELLHQMGLEFDIIPATEEEKSRETIPERYVTELARHKAQEVFRRVLAEQKKRESAGTPIAVIGSDTIVVLGDRILGKPHDRGEAFEMIEALQGREHQVMTAIALFWTDDAGKERQDSFCSITDVSVNAMEEEEIRRYLATGEADDKAGAYGIQGAFGMFVSEIHGSYHSVVGLPIAELYQKIKQDGLLD